MKAILLLALVAVAAAVPSTPAQWKADHAQVAVKQTMSFGEEAAEDATMRRLMGADGFASGSGLGGMSFSLVTSGSTSIDYSNNKLRTDITNVKMEMSMGGFMPPISFNVAGAATNVLRYDQHKNFTWGTMYDHDHPQGHTVCYCEPLAAAMPPFFVPPIATDGGAATWTNPTDQTDTRNVEKWTLDSFFRGPMDMIKKANTGFDLTQTFDFLVDTTTGGTDEVLQVKSTTSFNMQGGMSMNMEITQDFWDITPGMPPMSDFEPDPSICHCPEPPAPRTDVPAGAPTCPNTPQGCQCLTNQQAQALTFCDMIDYPFDAAIDATSTDEFCQSASQAAQSVVQMVNGAAASAACLSSLKQFYCSFYFQRCTDGSKLYVPPKPDLSSCGAAGSQLLKGTVHHSRRLGQTEESFGASEAQVQKASSPGQAYRTKVKTGSGSTSGSGSGNPSSSSSGGGHHHKGKKGSPGKDLAIVLCVVFALAGVAGAVWYVQKKRRNSPALELGADGSTVGGVYAPPADGDSAYAPLE